MAEISYTYIFENHFPTYSLEDNIVNSIKKAEENLLKGSEYMRNIQNVLGEMVSCYDEETWSSIKRDLDLLGIKQFLDLYVDLVNFIETFPVTSYPGSKLQNITGEIFNVKIGFSQRRQFLNKLQKIRSTLGYTSGVLDLKEIKMGRSIGTITNSTLLFTCSDTFIAIKWAEHNISNIYPCMMESVKYLINYFENMSAEYSLERVLMSVLFNKYP